MGKTKCRSCPECLQPVSSPGFICVCGASIVDSSTSTSTNSAGSDSDRLKRRRTERTKRVKPDFYDALELERQARKEKRRRVERGTKSTEKSPRKEVPPPPAPPPQHRMQLSVKKVLEEPEVKEEELEKIVLSEEKIAKFSLILDDINRKICASSWKGLF